MTKILNETTTVNTEKTISQIEMTLVRSGARGILKHYDNTGSPATLEFQVITKFGLRAIRLPANVEAVYQILIKGKHQWAVREREVTYRAQAARIAWRIVKDWVEAQMAIIQAEMVTMDEVFLPYMITDGGQTMYKALVTREFLLTAPAATKEER